MSTSWSVVVGNLGTVFVGKEAQARVEFTDYVGISKLPHVRASGEPVTLFDPSGEIVREYEPPPPEVDLWEMGFSRERRMRPDATLHDYWNAPGGGPLHFEWTDKPHRLLYDLIGEVLHLRDQIQRLENDR